MSGECDVLLDESDPTSTLIDAELGKATPFESEHGVYVDTVHSEFPFLPPGWESRLVPFIVGSFTAKCLEIHDLVISKLAAGRLKDYELVAVLIDLKLADLETIRARALSATEVRMRAILLARLQIVLESAGREAAVIVSGVASADDEPLE